MMVKLDVVLDGPDVFLMGTVDGKVYPPVKMRPNLTRVEVELEAIRRFLRRHQDWRYVAFEVDPYVAELLALHCFPRSQRERRAANRVGYLVRRRPGPVFFGARS